MCLYLDDEVGFSKGTFDFVNHIFVATDDTLYVHEIFWWEYLKNETLTCIKGQFSKNEAFWLIIYWRLVHYQSLVTRLVCYKEFGVSLGFLFSSYSRVQKSTSYFPMLYSQEILKLSTWLNLMALFLSVCIKLIINFK